MKKYLEATEIINWEHPDIMSLARELSQGCANGEEIAKKCFEWVRDDVKHSLDFQLNPVTYRASDVLKHKTGYCYAKSHLLAALLRANGIPTGLCYQRLSRNRETEPFCLHGLNAVYLEEHGWYRVDPRGNKEGVNAGFTPPREQLAFKPKVRGEADLPEIWSSPLQCVVDTLSSCSTYDEARDNLPDVELVSGYEEGA
jgi:transglutaminase-like putative cysteine protease